MSVLEKVRRWIDGDTAELALEEAARDAQIKPRSKGEEFIVKIAREIESVMQNELVPLPQGTVIIPCEYIVFLSNDDDKEWQGVKRKGLEQGLYHILAERARELAGKKKLETKTLTIELRIDGNLEKGSVRVQHSWEDSATNKTGVLSRPKGVTGSLLEKPMDSVITEPTRTEAAVGSQAPAFDPGRRGRPTSPNASIKQAEPIPQQDPEEMTRVNTRNTEIYRLEIWRSGVRQNVIPVFKEEVVVGRGSKSKPVDIPLSGDVEVSRRHLTIITDGAGQFWAVNEGKNPAIVENFDLPSGQRVSITPGVPINVCSYMLRIQPM